MYLNILVAIAAIFLTPSNGAIAAKWNPSDSELLFDLSDPIKAKKLKCPTHWKDAWCTFAKQYASMYLPREARPRSNSTPQMRKAPVPFKPNYAGELQGESFNKLYDRMLSSAYKNINKLKPFADHALQTKSCPRYLSLALAHRWEVELPKEDAKKRISALYEHALGCNDYSDIFRVRAGLLEYHFGNKSKALEYLDSALKIEEKRENFRALYWAKMISKELKKLDLEAKYQDMLFTQFPLSYYTILLKEEKKIDTLSGLSTKVLTRPKLEPKDQDQFELVLTEALKHKKATQKESKLIAFLASKQNHVISEANLKTITKLMDEKGLHRAKILLLGKQLSTNSTGITKEWLEELYPLAYFADVKKISTKAHPFVVMGFMRQESGFDPFIESPAGARGLLQLMPATAKWINGRKKMQSLYDTDFNIKLGSIYVSKNLERFDGSLIKAAAAYNGGVGFVKRWEKRYPINNEQLWSDLIPFGETRNYVPSVLVNAYWYQKLYNKLAPGGRVPSSVAPIFTHTEKNQVQVSNEN